MSYLTSSVGRKQIVAITGFLLIGFLVGHLAGNLFIFMGPQAFNAYAKKLASLRPGLYLIEGGLAFIFITHIFFTASLVIENIRARSKNYSVFHSKEPRSWATRLMPLTGTILIAFIIWHLLDFTFSDHHGVRSVINGEDFGLYGVVFNSFKDPFHSLLYILAMFSVAFHLYHGVESIIQTFGFNHPRYTPKIKQFSLWFSVIIAGLFSAIPIYVYLKPY